MVPDTNPLSNREGCETKPLNYDITVEVQAQIEVVDSTELFAE